jgi:hypothetical protein
LIRFKHRGDLSKTEKFLKHARDAKLRPILEKYAREGIQILASATPKDTGITSDSWDFEIVIKRTGFSIHWTNNALADGVPIVILLQYGHGTRSGTFVEGRDFINPATRPLFDKIAENVWKEVTSQ